MSKHSQQEIKNCKKKKSHVFSQILGQEQLTKLKLFIVTMISYSQTTLPNDIEQVRDTPDTRWAGALLQDMDIYTKSYTCILPGFDYVPYYQQN